ncbi:hypothetical protein SNE40_021290 [Patella caerulea]|uniref:Uncharacterized protein n=1 Tax=Patella caerulea TaxID=87958 RepID=A0AAN8G3N2_PATCE
MADEKPLQLERRRQIGGIPVSSINKYKKLDKTFTVHADLTLEPRPPKSKCLKQSPDRYLVQKENINLGSTQSFRKENQNASQADFMTKENEPRACLTERENVDSRPKVKSVLSSYIARKIFIRRSKGIFHENDKLAIPQVPRKISDLKDKFTLKHPGENLENHLQRREPCPGNVQEEFRKQRSIPKYKEHSRPVNKNITDLPSVQNTGVLGYRDVENIMPQPTKISDLHLDNQSGRKQQKRDRSIAKYHPSNPSGKTIINEKTNLPPDSTESGQLHKHISYYPLVSKSNSYNDTGSSLPPKSNYFSKGSPKALVEDDSCPINKKIYRFIPGDGVKKGVEKVFSNCTTEDIEEKHDISFIQQTQSKLQIPRNKSQQVGKYDKQKDAIFRIEGQDCKWNQTPNNASLTKVNTNDEVGSYSSIGYFGMSSNKGYEPYTDNSYITSHGTINRSESSIKHETTFDIRLAHFAPTVNQEHADSSSPIKRGNVHSGAPESPDGLTTSFSVGSRCGVQYFKKDVKQHGGRGHLLNDGLRLPDKERSSKTNVSYITSPKLCKSEKSNAKRVHQDFRKEIFDYSDQGTTVHPTSCTGLSTDVGEDGVKGVGSSKGEKLCVTWFDQIDGLAKSDSLKASTKRLILKMENNDRDQRKESMEGKKSLRKSTKSRLPTRDIGPLTQYPKLENRTYNSDNTAQSPSPSRIPRRDPSPNVMCVNDDPSTETITKPIESYAEKEFDENQILEEYKSSAVGLPVMTKLPKRVTTTSRVQQEAMIKISSAPQKQTHKSHLPTRLDSSPCKHVVKRLGTNVDPILHYDIIQPSNNIPFIHSTRDLSNNPSQVTDRKSTRDTILYEGSPFPLRSSQISDSDFKPCFRKEQSLGKEPIADSSEDVFPASHIPSRVISEQPLVADDIILRDYITRVVGTRGISDNRTVKYHHLNKISSRTWDSDLTPSNCLNDTDDEKEGGQQQLVANINDPWEHQGELDNTLNGCDQNLCDVNLVSDTSNTPISEVQLYTDNLAAGDKNKGGERGLNIQLTQEGKYTSKSGETHVYNNDEKHNVFSPPLNYCLLQGVTIIQNKDCLNSNSVVKDKLQQNIYQGSYLKTTGISSNYKQSQVSKIPTFGRSPKCHEQRAKIACAEGGLVDTWSAKNGMESDSKQTVSTQQQVMPSEVPNSSKCESADRHSKQKHTRTFTKKINQNGVSREPNVFVTQITNDGGDKWIKTKRQIVETSSKSRKLSSVKKTLPVESKIIKLQDNITVIKNSESCDTNTRNTTPVEPATHPDDVVLISRIPGVISDENLKVANVDKKNIETIQTQDKTEKRYSENNECCTTVKIVSEIYSEETNGDVKILSSSTDETDKGIYNNNSPESWQTHYKNGTVFSGNGSLVESKREQTAESKSCIRQQTAKGVSKHRSSSSKAIQLIDRQSNTLHNNNSQDNCVKQGIKEKRKRRKEELASIENSDIRRERQHESKDELSAKCDLLTKSDREKSVIEGQSSSKNKLSAKGSKLPTPVKNSDFVKDKLENETNSNLKEVFAHQNTVLSDLCERRKSSCDINRCEYNRVNNEPIETAANNTSLKCNNNVGELTYAHNITEYADGKKKHLKDIFRSSVELSAENINNGVDKNVTISRKDNIPEHCDNIIHVYSDNKSINEHALYSNTVNGNSISEQDLSSETNELKTCDGNHLNQRLSPSKIPLKKDKKSRENSQSPKRRRYLSPRKKSTYVVDNNQCNLLTDNKTDKSLAKHKSVCENKTNSPNHKNTLYPIDKKQLKLDSLSVTLHTTSHKNTNDPYISYPYDSQSNNKQAKAHQKYDLKYEQENIHSLCNECLNRSGDKTSLTCEEKTELTKSQLGLDLSENDKTEVDVVSNESETPGKNTLSVRGNSICDKSSLETEPYNRLPISKTENNCSLHAVEENKLSVTCRDIHNKLKDINTKVTDLNILQSNKEVEIKTTKDIQNIKTCLIAELNQTDKKSSEIICDSVLKSNDFGDNDLSITEFKGPVYDRYSHLDDKSVLILHGGVMKLVDTKYCLQQFLDLEGEKFDEDEDICQDFDNQIEKTGFKGRGNEALNANQLTNHTFTDSMENNDKNQRQNSSDGQIPVTGYSADHSLANLTLNKGQTSVSQTRNKEGKIIWEITPQEQIVSTQHVRSNTGKSQPYLVKVDVCEERGLSGLSSRGQLEQFNTDNQHDSPQTCYNTQDNSPLKDNTRGLSPKKTQEPSPKHAKRWDSSPKHLQRNETSPCQLKKETSPCSGRKSRPTEVFKKSVSVDERGHEELSLLTKLDRLSRGLPIYDKKSPEIYRRAKSASPDMSDRWHRGQEPPADKKNLMPRCQERHNFKRPTNVPIQPASLKNSKMSPEITTKSSSVERQNLSQRKAQESKNDRKSTSTPLSPKSKKHIHEDNLNPKPNAKKTTSSRLPKMKGVEMKSEPQKASVSKCSHKSDNSSSTSGNRKLKGSGSTSSQCSTCESSVEDDRFSKTSDTSLRSAISSKFSTLSSSSQTSSGMRKKSLASVSSQCSTRENSAEDDRFSAVSDISVLSSISGTVTRKNSKMVQTTSQKTSGTYSKKLKTVNKNNKDSPSTTRESSMESQVSVASDISAMSSVSTSGKSRKSIQCYRNTSPKTLKMRNDPSRTGKHVPTSPKSVKRSGSSAQTSVKMSDVMSALDLQSVTREGSVESQVSDVSCISSASTSKVPIYSRRTRILSSPKPSIKSRPSAKTSQIPSIKSIPKSSTSSLISSNNIKSKSAITSSRKVGTANIKNSQNTVSNQFAYVASKSQPAKPRSKIAVAATKVLAVKKFENSLRNPNLNLNKQRIKTTDKKRSEPLANKMGNQLKKSANNLTKSQKDLLSLYSQLEEDSQSVCITSDGERNDMDNSQLLAESVPNILQDSSEQVQMIDLLSSNNENRNQSDTSDGFINEIINIEETIDYEDNENIAETDNKSDLKQSDCTDIKITANMGQAACRDTRVKDSVHDKASSSHFKDGKEKIKNPAKKSEKACDVENHESSAVKSKNPVSRSKSNGKLAKTRCDKISTTLTTSSNLSSVRNREKYTEDEKSTKSKQKENKSGEVIPCGFYQSDGQYQHITDQVKSFCTAGESHQLANFYPNLGQNNINTFPEDNLDSYNTDQSAEHSCVKIDEQNDILINHLEKDDISGRQNKFLETIECENLKSHNSAFQNFGHSDTNLCDESERLSDEHCKNLDVNSEQSELLSLSVNTVNNQYGVDVRKVVEMHPDVSYQGSNLKDALYIKSDHQLAGNIEELEPFIQRSTTTTSQNISTDSVNNGHSDQQIRHSGTKIVTMALNDLPVLIKDGQQKNKVFEKTSVKDLTLESENDISTERSSKLFKRENADIVISELRDNDKDEIRIPSTSHDSDKRQFCSDDIYNSDVVTLIYEKTCQDSINHQRQLLSDILDMLPNEQSKCPPPDESWSSRTGHDITNNDNTKFDRLCIVLTNQTDNKHIYSAKNSNGSFDKYQDRLSVDFSTQSLVEHEVDVLKSETDVKLDCSREDKMTSDSKNNFDKTDSDLINKLIHTPKTLRDDFLICDVPDLPTETNGEQIRPYDSYLDDEHQNGLNKFENSCILSYVDFREENGGEAFITSGNLKEKDFISQQEFYDSDEENLQEILSREGEIKTSTLGGEGRNGCSVFDGSDEGISSVTTFPQDINITDEISDAKIDVKSRELLDVDYYSVKFDTSTAGSNKLEHVKGKTQTEREQEYFVCSDDYNTTNADFSEVRNDKTIFSHSNSSHDSQELLEKNSDEIRDFITDEQISFLNSQTVEPLDISRKQLCLNNQNKTFGENVLFLQQCDNQDRNITSVKTDFGYFCDLDKSFSLQSRHGASNNSLDKSIEESEEISTSSEIDHFSKVCVSFCPTMTSSADDLGAQAHEAACSLMGVYQGNTNVNMADNMPGVIRAYGNSCDPVNGARIPLSATVISNNMEKQLNTPLSCQNSDPINITENNIDSLSEIGTTNEMEQYQNNKMVEELNNQIKSKHITTTATGVSGKFSRTNISKNSVNFDKLMPKSQPEKISKLVLRDSKSSVLTVSYNGSHISSHIQDGKCFDNANNTNINGGNNLDNLNLTINEDTNSSAQNQDCKFYINEGFTLSSATVNKHFSDKMLAQEQKKMEEIDKTPRNDHTTAAFSVTNSDKLQDSAMFICNTQSHSVLSESAMKKNEIPNLQNNLMSESSNLKVQTTNMQANSSSNHSQMKIGYSIQRAASNWGRLRARLPQIESTKMTNNSNVKGQPMISCNTPEFNERIVQLRQSAEKFDQARNKQIKGCNSPQLESRFRRVAKAVIVNSKTNVISETEQGELKINQEECLPVLSEELPETLDLNIPKDQTMISENQPLEKLVVNQDKKSKAINKSERRDSTKTKSSSFKQKLTKIQSEETVVSTKHATLSKPKKDEREMENRDSTMTQQKINNPYKSNISTRITPSNKKSCKPSSTFPRKIPSVNKGSNKSTISINDKLNKPEVTFDHNGQTTEINIVAINDDQVAEMNKIILAIKEGGGEDISEIPESVKSDDESNKAETCLEVSSIRSLNEEVTSQEIEFNLERNIQTNYQDHIIPQSLEEDGKLNKSEIQIVDLFIDENKMDQETESENVMDKNNQPDREADHDEPVNDEQSSIETNLNNQPIPQKVSTITLIKTPVKTSPHQQLKPTSTQSQIAEIADVTLQNRDDSTELSEDDPEIKMARLNRFKATKALWKKTVGQLINNAKNPESPEKDQGDTDTCRNKLSPGRDRILIIRRSLSERLTTPITSPIPTRKYLWVKGEGGIWKKEYCDSLHDGSLSPCPGYSRPQSVSPCPFRSPSPSSLIKDVRPDFSSNFGKTLTSPSNISNATTNVQTECTLVVAPEIILNGEDSTLTVSKPDMIHGPGIITDELEITKEQKKTSQVKERTSENEEKQSDMEGRTLELGGKPSEITKLNLKITERNLEFEEKLIEITEKNAQDDLDVETSEEFEIEPVYQNIGASMKMVTENKNMELAISDIPEKNKTKNDPKNLTERSNNRTSGMLISDVISNTNISQDENMKINTCCDSHLCHDVVSTHVVFEGSKILDINPTEIQHVSNTELQNKNIMQKVPKDEYNISDEVCCKDKILHPNNQKQELAKIPDFQNNIVQRQNISRMQVLNSNFETESVEIKGREKTCDKGYQSKDVWQGSVEYIPESPIVYKLPKTKETRTSETSIDHHFTELKVVSPDQKNVTQQNGTIMSNSSTYCETIAAQNVAVPRRMKKQGKSKNLKLLTEGAVRCPSLVLEESYSDEELLDHEDSKLRKCAVKFDSYKSVYLDNSSSSRQEESSEKGQQRCTVPETENGKVRPIF